MNLQPVDRAYSARQEHQARATAFLAQTRKELQDAFIKAAFDHPGAMVPCPGSEVSQRPVSWLISAYIDEAVLAEVLRDAAKGREVHFTASLLLSVIAGRFANEQADIALEMAEGEFEAANSPDWDAINDARRDDELEGA